MLYIPPESLDTVEADNLLDILHPAHGCRRSRRLGKWRLGYRGSNWCLWKISSFC